MNSSENEVENVNDGFGYGQLEHGQFELGNSKKTFGCGNGCLTNLNLCTSYLGLGKQEIWLKIKDAKIVRKYANEHRLSILGLFILISFCFFILLHLSLQVGAGIKRQNIKGNEKVLFK